MPFQEILDDMVTFRKRNGRWPEATEFRGLRHMTSVMGWNCFFAGYKDAIRQANELWTAQHPRDESNCVGAVSVR